MDPGGTTRSRSAVIIGAGIGGMAAALALVRDGWETVVIERAERLEPVGAGLAVAPNGLRALDALGVGDGVRSMAAMQGEAGLRRPDGRWLYRTSDEAIRQRFGDPVVVVHRADLVGRLADALPTGVVRLGRSASVEDTGDAHRRARVRVDDGSGLDADLVIAADGARSATRATLFPDSRAPRSTGMVAWRFVARPPAPVQPSETWGRGVIVGLQPLADGRAYCYVAARQGRSAALPACVGWHEPIPQMLAAVPPKDVIYTPLADLRRPLPSFACGRVAMCGDAAHPMTPFMGQGACQALEDAVTLARALRRLPSGGHLVEALEGWSYPRIQRTSMITRRSRRIGRLAGLGDSRAVAVRDRLLAAFAGRISQDRLAKAFDPVFGWRP